MAIQKSDQIFTIIISICGQKIQQLLTQTCIPRDTPASVVQWYQHPKLSPSLCEGSPLPQWFLRTVMRIDYRIWKHVVNPGLMDDSYANSVGKTAWIPLLCGGEILYRLLLDWVESRPVVISGVYQPISCSWDLSWEIHDDTKYLATPQQDSVP